MQKTPLSQAVTKLYSLIFKTYIFQRYRSSGRSSSQIQKMYRKVASIQQISRIFSATDFTGTTVTKFITSFIITINIIELLIVTVRKIAVKKAIAVTNWHKVAQTGTHCHKPTGTRYNYYINHVTITFLKNLCQ